MSDKTERRRIAVVGSGISGLTACYLLSSEHDVTLFEAAADLGMDAHSVDVPLPGGDTARIDMPLRVFSPKYYPHLTSLYNHVNIKSVPENYSGSFRLNDIVAPYFAYQNMLFGAVSLPFVSWRHVFSCEFWSHVRQMFKFHWTASTDLSSGRLASLSLGQYLQSAGYTDCFVHKFFIPFVCAICTCTFQAALDYPADVVVDYLIRRFLFGVRRADGGTKTVVHRLSKQCKEIKLNARIQCVQHTANHVKVTECNGNTSTFDDVVIATQAHLALKLLAPGTAPLAQKALSSVPHERSRVVLHSDVSLMPRDRRDWRSVNFVIDSSLPRPMASIWLNAVGLLPAGSPDLFQTWAPTHTPRAETILSEADFDRPVMDYRTSRDALSLLSEAQGQHRIFFCGSYSLWAMPLLENAVTSAMSVCERLGADTKWLRQASCSEGIVFSPTALTASQTAAKSSCFRNFLLAWSMFIMLAVLSVAIQFGPPSSY